jgi:H+/Cl- antiporter ClcA
MNEWLYILIGIFGAIFGYIAYWLRIIWQRRDIVSWSIDYWSKALADGKVTTGEILDFIEQLVDKFNLRDRVIIQKK